MEEKNNGVDRSSENKAKEINATELLRQLKENIKLNPVTTAELEDSFSAPVSKGENESGASEKKDELEQEFLDQSVKQDLSDEEASKGQRFKISKRKKANIDTLAEDEGAVLEEKTVTVKPEYKSFVKHHDEPVDVNDLLKKYLSEDDYNVLRKIDVASDEPIRPAPEKEEPSLDIPSEKDEVKAEPSSLLEQAAAVSAAPSAGKAFGFVKNAANFSEEEEITDEELKSASMEFEDEQQEIVAAEAIAEDTDVYEEEAIAEADSELDEIFDQPTGEFAKGSEAEAAAEIATEAEVEDESESFSSKLSGKFGAFRSKFKKKEKNAPQIDEEAFEQAKAELEEEFTDDGLTLEEKIKNAEDYASTMEQTKAVPKPEIDEIDKNIMIALGMEEELEKTVGIDAVNEIYRELDRQGEGISDSGENIQDSKDAKEFTSMTQTKQFFKQYKKTYRMSLLKMALAVVFTIALFFYENISVMGGALPAAFSPKFYPVVYAMVSLQILVLCAALIWRELYEGVRAIINRRPIPESITVVMLLGTLIYHVIICAVPSFTYDAKLYNFPAALCVLLTLVYEFMNLKREIFSFNIVASKRVKYAIGRVKFGEDELEKEAFSEFLPANPSIFKVNKANFINGFFKRSRANTNNKPIIGILILASAALSVVLGIVGFWYSKSMNTALIFAYAAFMISLPFSAFLTYSYPFYRASKEAYTLDSAIIGESSLDEYSSASAISFDDKDVFPSYGVKVKSVKVYGLNRIDHVIYYAGSMFRHVGGPLADVFEGATRDIGHSDDVELLEVDDSGLEAIIDDTHIYIGTADYLRRKEFEPVMDEDDADIENDGETSIMHMVVNEEVTAKFYVSYIIDPDFEAILKHLYKSGMCVGIKTFDPNIDNRMLSTKIKISKYPVKILKCRGSEDFSETRESIDSGVVSKNSAKTLLQTLSLCDRVNYMTKTNLVVKIFAMIVSVVLLGFVLVLGHSANLPSVYVALYQLFWILPMAVIAKLFI